MSHKNLMEIKTLIEGAEVSLQQAKNVLSRLTGDEDTSLIRKAQSQGQSHETEEGQVIEGVFDGQNMIGPDGKEYSIAANYASKSKLVEGDLLKLTIDTRGNFIYKQIGPIERIRLKGRLAFEEKSEEWRVLADGKAYKVLLASVTYFKGNDGDEVVIVVPKDKSSTWAAVENVIRNSSASSGVMSYDTNKEATQDFNKPSVTIQTTADHTTEPEKMYSYTKEDEDNVHKENVQNQSNEPVAEESFKADSFGTNHANESENFETNDDFGTI